MKTLERELSALIGNVWLHRILWLKVIWILTLVTVVIVGPAGFAALVIYVIVAWRWGVPWTQSWVQRDQEQRRQQSSSF